jgi:hypothetical protein
MRLMQLRNLFKGKKVEKALTHVATQRVLMVLVIGSLNAMICKWNGIIMIKRCKCSVNIWKEV